MTRSLHLILVLTCLELRPPSVAARTVFVDCLHPGLKQTVDSIRSSHRPLARAGSYLGFESRTGSLREVLYLRLKSSVYAVTFFYMFSRVSESLARNISVKAIFWFVCLSTGQMEPEQGLKPPHAQPNLMKAGSYVLAKYFLVAVIDRCYGYPWLGLHLLY